MTEQQITKIRREFKHGMPMSLDELSASMYRIAKILGLEYDEEN